MAKYTLTYLNEDCEKLGMKSEITAANEEHAIIEFSRLHPNNSPYISVEPPFGKVKTVPNPLVLQSEQDEARRKQNDTELVRLEKILEKEKSQKELDVASITNLITHLEKRQPEELEFCQLEKIVGNFFDFPKLIEEETNVEIYKLREKLYMLSFCNTKIQVGIQTRILATTNTSTSSSKSQNNLVSGASMFAASAGLMHMSKMNEKLDEIAENTEGVGDFFGD